MRKPSNCRISTLVETRLLKEGFILIFPVQGEISCSFHVFNYPKPMAIMQKAIGETFPEFTTCAILNMDANHELKKPCQNSRVYDAKVSSKSIMSVVTSTAANASEISLSSHIFSPRFLFSFLTLNFLVISWKQVKFIYDHIPG